MNKLFDIIKTTILMLGIVNIAQADNRWTGFYIGANAGFIYDGFELHSQQLGFTDPSEKYNTSSNFLIFSSGIQLGYMYQFSNAFVSGIEASFNFNSNQKDTVSWNSQFNPDVYDQFTFKNQMQTSIKGRIGHNLYWHKNTFLPYIVTGVSFADVGLSYKNEGGDYYKKNTTQAGWLIGTGLEWAFGQHWSLRTEYYYASYGKAILMKIPSIYGLEDTDGQATIDLSANNVAVSIQYRL